MKLPHRWYSEFITEEKKQHFDRLAEATAQGEILNVMQRGIRLGEHIQLSLESFFKVGSVDLNDQVIAAKAREFLRSALYLVEIGHRALAELHVDKLLLDDGKKIDWGIMRAVAESNSIPVDVINMGIRGVSVRFEVDRPPNATVRMRGWDKWRHLKLTDEQECDLDTYLQRRETVPYEYRARYWRSSLTDPAQVWGQVGLPEDVDGLVFAMFPNLGFDAGKTKCAAAAFHSPNDWASLTVEMFKTRPEHHLILKAHPAEHYRRTRDSVLDAVIDRFDPLPPNVHLVPADTEITAQSLIRLADVALVYTSTVAVEAAALGRPVILVGGGWNAGRGIACEVRSPQEYTDLLRSILTGSYMPQANRTLARRYAYALFFRNDIPINHFCIEDVNVSDLTIKSLVDLLPSADPSMDAICRGILYDEPFENPETRQAEPMSVGIGIDQS